MVEFIFENGCKREKNKIGCLIEVYLFLFIVEYKDIVVVLGVIDNIYVEFYIYLDILIEKILICYFDDELVE